jgi:putative zinc finger protein
MNQVHCNLSHDREETLIAYLYDDIDPVVRATFDDHLATCERCRSDLKALRGVRTQLARWAPPEPGFIRAASGDGAASQSGAAGRASWWRDIPAWAQVAAALLFVGISAGIANLDVRYDQSGLTVRTGWSRSTAPAAAVVPAAERAESAPWRSELAALERQLRAEMHAPSPAPAPVRAAVSDADILRRVRALIDESERRQRNELALRVGETVAELNAKRQAELRNIGTRLRETENKIGIEVMRQRQSLNYLINVSQRQ